MHKDFVMFYENSSRNIVSTSSGPLRIRGHLLNISQNKRFLFILINILQWPLTNSSSDLSSLDFSDKLFDFLGLIQKIISGNAY